jgi:protein associated with RNAse G/E
MHSLQQITIISRSFDFKIRKKWLCSLLEFNPPHLMCYGYFENAVTHPHLGTIPRGTLSLESFWSNRFYNLFVFFESDRKIRNLYFNVCRPPRISPSSVDFVDLDIDIVIWPDGSFETLDIDEFQANSTRFSYPHDLESEIRKAVMEITSLAKNCRPEEIVRAVFGEFENILKGIPE